MKVLLVDDDQSLRNALARVLEIDGHEVHTATDGIHGLRLLATFAFDVVITDVVMPDMEGLEFLRRIRRMPSPPKVIVMSGGGHGVAGDYLKLASSFGADGILEKPIMASALREMVATVMKGEE